MNKAIAIAVVALSLTGCASVVVPATALVTVGVVGQQVVKAYPSIIEP